MTYFVVMGTLALSLSVLTGWVLWRGLRWLGTRLGIAAGKSEKGQRSANARPRQRSLAFNKAEKARQPRKQATTSGKSASRGSSRDKAGPTPPWRLTRWLAPLASLWPLALVVALLYGGVRLAEFGIQARPESAPAAYHRLVEGLGYGALGLSAIVLLGALASWRCLRADEG